MDKRWGLGVALVLAGCNSQGRAIDEALTKMQAEITDGRQVVVDRQSVSMHYDGNIGKAICGQARVTRRENARHSEQQHFLIFPAGANDTVLFFFDDSKTPLGREEFKKFWNGNCVGS